MKIHDYSKEDLMAMDVAALRAILDPARGPSSPNYCRGENA